MQNQSSAIAFELLGMYKRMAATVIWEYSTDDIKVDMERLEKECQEYEDRIRRSSDE